MSVPLGAGSVAGSVRIHTVRYSIAARVSSTTSAFGSSSDAIVLTLFVPAPGQLLACLWPRADFGPLGAWARSLRV
jgi:hypothetical protein